MVPPPTTVPGDPKFLVALIDALPGFISKSEFAEALRKSRLRVSHAVVLASFGWLDSRRGLLAFR